MKIYSLILLSFLGLSTSIIAMEEEVLPERLNFNVDSALNITGYSRENMKFAVLPSEFMGKCILDVIKLNEKDYSNIKEAFDKANKNEETVKKSYVFDQKKFFAAITKMNENDGAYSFFVKIKPTQDLFK